jgi:UDP-N-acetylmuramoyl-tripeptide--D-alanyl-D-alanine ligase
MLRLAGLSTKAAPVARKKAAKIARHVREPARRWSLVLPAVTKRFLNPRVTYVGVTGSCAKTTTTTLIGAVLSAAGECCTGADQNHIEDVARTVLSIGPTTKYCVQEVCGSRPGKIRKQTRILRPEIGVITTIGGDHYTRYRTLEATAKEKGQLAEVLPARGALILNADDPNVRAIAPRSRAKTITYGLSPDADVRAVDVSSDWPDRLSLTLLYGDESIRIASRLVGEFWTTSILAAVACGLVCGIDLQTCAEVIAKTEPVFGRYSVHHAPGGAIYVFDHKAPMWTFAKSFEFLARARAPRRTMVIGAISDSQGKASLKYRRVARQALEVAERVVFVGPHSSHVSKIRESEFKGRLFSFETTYEATEFMKQQQAVRGELVFLKGSITVDHLERIFLTQIESVVCWRQGCGKVFGCPQCGNFRKPTPPPFGLGCQNRGSRESEEEPFESAV